MKTPKQAQRDARKLFRLCLVNGVLNGPRVRRIVTRMVQAPHGADLAVLTHLHRLVRRNRANHRVEVTSAVALPPAVRKEIEAGLLRRYGRDLLTTFAEDPSLLGGIRVKAGSDVYDASVKGGLAALARRF